MKEVVSQDSFGGKITFICLILGIAAIPLFLMYCTLCTVDPSFRDRMLKTFISHF